MRTHDIPKYKCKNILNLGILCIKAFCLTQLPVLNHFGMIPSVALNLILINKFQNQIFLMTVKLWSVVATI